MSQFIYGIHDMGAWVDWVGQAGKTAWCVHTEAIGADPSDRSGKDYRHPCITPIVRLNHAYGKGYGTIPTTDKYDAFAQRCANFVAASQGIQYVVIGNEIALEWEWPTDQPIHLTDYVRCYRLCFDAIKRVAPHARVAPAAVAPWNASTPDAPDWVTHLATMLNMLRGQVDWICLHAYTRGYGAGAFTTGAKMDNPQFRHRASGWETLWEFMQVIPAHLRHVPVMITEADGNEPWPANNTGWIGGMYAQIGQWNAQPGNQQIQAACLFRWLPDDKQWSLAHSPGAAEDFRQALTRGYQWRPSAEVSTSENPKSTQPATMLKAGDRVTVVVASVNVRNAPSLQAEVALKLGQGDSFVIEAIYTADGLIWLQGPEGWVAEVAPDGTRLVDKADGANVTTKANERAEIVRRLAAEYGVDEKLALAVIQIESGGSGFRGDLLLTRFEPHVFQTRFLELWRRHFAVGEPQWAGEHHRYRPQGEGAWQPFHGDQGAEHHALRLATIIGRLAAFEAASYGSGQIMGFNYAACGYDSAEAMMAAFASGEEAQLRAMFDFFRNRRDGTGQSCLDYLRTGDLVAFATLYNGPGQAQYYAGLIRQRMEQ